MATDLNDKIVKAKDCWIWTAGRHRQGYPMMRDPRDMKKMILVSRYFMEKKVGYKLKKDQRVKNTCGNILCVNPDHYILAEYGEQEWKCVRNFIPEWQREQIRQEYHNTEKYHGQKKDLITKYEIHYETLNNILKGK